MLKKIITVFTVATLAVTAAQALVAPTAQSRPASASVPAPPGYTPPPIKWGACASATLTRYGAQCGMLVAPMDYDKPSGPKIELAVSRVLHTTDAADYQGVMLVNPGGPGGSGLIYSIFQTFVPHNAGAGYDWIGFDPRGVGSSVPSLSCNPNFAHGDRPPYRPSTPQILKAWVNRSKDYADKCAASPGSALFEHVKTTDSAKDMESLRKALGQQQINFYGFSYGTYLGSVYATLFPDRVRRFVFDSTVDPRKVFYQSNQAQDVAFQKTSEIYFKWLAKYSSVYHVGTTQAEVSAKYYAAIDTLDQHAAGGILGGDELTDVFTSPAYYVYGWQDVAQAWSSYVNQGDASALIAMYQSSYPTTKGSDNGTAMYLGTQCTDAPWPQSQSRLNKDNANLDRNYPFLTWSNAWFNGPCAYWHYNSDLPVDVTGRRVSTPILMIDETLDAATPYPGSLYVRRIFPSASLIEGKNGTTHAGSLSGVSCTDNSIANYLLDGTVPARQSGNHSDKVCPPVPKPNPLQATAKASTQRAADLAMLRQGLIDAQLH